MQQPQPGMESEIRFGFKDWYAVFMTAVFVGLFLVGSTLNLTLLYAILKEKLYRSSTNLYIMNLALSDLMIAVGILFFPTMNYAFTAWPFGDAGCKVFEVIRDSVTPVSLLTLTAMSVQRYQAIFSAQLRKEHRVPSFNLFSCLASKTGITIVLMWLASIVSMIPITLLGSLPDLPPAKIADVRTCVLDRYEYLEPKILVVIRCTVTYVIPMIIIGVNYGRISCKLFAVSYDLEKHRDSPALDRSRRRALSRARAILLLVLVFTVCSFPCHFFWIFYFARNDVQSSTFFWDNWREVGFYLFYAYPILNPLFLYATSEQYRSLYNKYLFCCRVRVVHDHDEDEEGGEKNGGTGASAPPAPTGTEEVHESSFSSNPVFVSA